MTTRQLAVVALRKLPKRLLRRALARAGTTYKDPCFVTACAHPTAVDYTDKLWRRLAAKYRLTWNGNYITHDGSHITALSTAWEHDHAWLRRAVRRRLAA